MRRSALAFVAFLAAAPVAAQEVAPATAPPLTVDAINAADLATIPAQYVATTDDDVAERQPDPAVVRLQVLLDRAGASPGVIDGFDGDNVRKAVVAFELMLGVPTDGVLDPDIIAALETGDPVIGEYQVTQDDVDAIGPDIPTDYAEMATRDFLGYTSLGEELGERFHMTPDLLAAINPGAGFAAGDHVYVAAYGPDRTGEVARIEADKSLRQVRAYDAAGTLLVAYPATIGSEDNPSPSGSHIVEGVAPMPTYTYNPKVNFQQGDNTSVLTIPPGPNGPVGSMWIDLSEPTFGIHGTPEPSKIDKTGSHGCVRLTNWDANELAKMVKPGVPVDFVG
ncbi:L,D-transpeptidase family protein [Devosia sp. CN2-171]|uniref:L,D-transpeptidase family protein n=1 Tax=Devosia sp. CN2-171 TaxID=3400909 RepID=UPI003BF79E6A